MPTNLDATRLKRGQDVIYNKRRQAIVCHIAILLRLTHVQSADVYGVQLSIIAEGHRGNLRFAVLIDGGQSPKPLGLYVLQFDIRKLTHDFTSVILSFFDCMLLLTCRMELCNTILRSCCTRSSRGACSLEQACQACEGSQWDHIKVDQM